MRYNSERHHRRSLRLPKYDYASVGKYFITICAYQRQCLFGEILGGEMQSSEFGEVVQRCWQAIPIHFPNVQLDEFVVMPNHIHGVIFITDSDRRGMALPCPYDRKFGKPIAGSLPTIIGSFKSAVTKHINQIRNMPETPVWQRNYYEHIIRNETALQHVQHYIQSNPLAWKQDQLHPNCASKW